MGRPATPLINRMLWRTWVENIHECWLWLGGTNSWGYGSVNAPDKMRAQAHRVMYEFAYGPLSSSDVLLHHTCKEPLCVNPLHLEEISVAEHNRLHGINQFLGNFQRDKTHCPHGHPYTADNTFIATSGGRACKTCRRKWQQDYRAKRAERLGADQ